MALYSNAPKDVSDVHHICNNTSKAPFTKLELASDCILLKVRKCCLVERNAQANVSLTLRLYCKTENTNIRCCCPTVLTNVNNVAGDARLFQNRNRS